MYIIARQVRRHIKPAQRESNMEKKTPGDDFIMKDGILKKCANNELTSAVIPGSVRKIELIKFPIKH